MDEEKIFLRAVEFESVEERSVYLDTACQGSVALRQSVESLIRHHYLAADRFLDVPPKELERTFAGATTETLSDACHDRLLDLLAPSKNPDCIGELGSYEILEVIGRGGMGIVLRAHDSKLKRIVAIKLMNAPVVSSSLACEQFLREAQSAAAVKHDHVVTLHAIHDQGPSPYIVMEYIDGNSLEKLVDNGKPLSPEKIVRLGKQIAAGLEAAHRRGVVHRDIKPANILLDDKSDRIKITDFGLAREVGDGHCPREGTLAGTPQYMSPEQARGHKSDYRSDLFSLGSVLYTLCTGRPAFPGETALAALRGVCHDQPPPICELNPQIPRWLAELVARLMAKDPDNRPHSAGEVVELLNRGDTISARWPVQPCFRGGTQTGSRIRNALLPLGAVAIMLAGITIVIQRHGKTTQVEVPFGSHVRVTKSGVVELELPDERNRQASSAVFPPQSIQDIATQLVQLNPDFDGKLEPKYAGGQLVELRLITDHVTDISPLKQFSGLQRLVLRGTAPGNGQLADLSPLAGMRLVRFDGSYNQISDLTPLKDMRLEQLELAFTKVADLSPLQRLPLTQLFVQETPVADLSPLRNCPLKELNISATQVSDFAPLRGLKLIAFYCDATHATDITPLSGMPLRIFNWRGYDQSNQRHQDVIKSISTLEWIDSLTAAEYWQQFQAK